MKRRSLRFFGVWYLRRECYFHRLRMSMQRMDSKMDIPTIMITGKKSSILRMLTARWEFIQRQNLDWIKI